MKRSDRNFYQTGQTAPRKSHQGIIAFLLILVIILCGVVSLLSMMNIRLFRMLEQQEKTSVQFSENGEVAKTNDPAAVANSGFSSAAIGITGQDISALYRSYNAWPEGIYVSWVDPDGPADRADVRFGDILVAVNGAPITSGEDFLYASQRLQQGQTFQITVFRDQQELSLTLTANAP